MVEKVLIVWEHGSNLGHMARLLPIAQALKASGCSVLFAVTDVAAARRYLTPAGFAWRPLPSVPRAQIPAGAPINYADILLRVGFNRPGEALACLSEWFALFAAIQPQAVLIDESPLALYAARTANLPVLALGHGFEILPSYAPGPCFTPWADNAQALAAQAEVDLQRCLEELATQVSTLTTAPAVSAQHAPASLQALYEENGCALCTWPELDHFDRRTADPFIYTGPIWSELPGTPDIDWPDKPGAKVLCYLNLQDKRHDLLWQSLTQQGSNVLVLSPAGTPKACEAARGWGLTVVEYTVSLPKLIAECDAVVGHGGMGLSSMALHAGKPLMLLPQQMEQFILAYRLSRQGLALATIRHNDKRGVQAKGAQLLQDEALKQRAQAFANRYAGFTPTQAVTRVVQWLQA